MRFIIENLPIVLSLVAGIALIVTEMFLPGFGVPGIAGVSLMICAVVLTWINYGAMYGALMTLFVMVLITAAIIISLRSASKGKLSRSRLFLKNDQESDKQPAPEGTGPAVGDTGVTETALRPAGIALINGQRVSVVSDGQYLDKQVQVQVVTIEGSRIVVGPTK